MLELLSLSVTVPPCFPQSLPSLTYLSCAPAGLGLLLPPPEPPSEPLLVLVVVPGPLLFPPSSSRASGWLPDAAAEDCPSSSQIGWPARPSRGLQAHMSRIKLTSPAGWPTDPRTQLFVLLEPGSSQELPLSAKVCTTYLIPGDRCEQHLDSSLSLTLGHVGRPKPIHAIP